MHATTGHNWPARGARWRPGALGAWIAGVLKDLRAQQQLAADRRLIQEMPDRLLKDMGIDRARTGVPADPAAARLLRHFAGWR